MTDATPEGRTTRARQRARQPASGAESGRHWHRRRVRARPQALEGADRLPRGRIHDPAGRQHRQRRAAVHPHRPARRAERTVLGALRLRADVRPGTRAGRSARRRARTPPHVRHRRGRLHPRERGLRHRTERHRARVRPPGAGPGRRLRHTTGERADPATVPRRRTRSRVRPARRDDRHLHRRRSAARRADHRRGRRPGGLALGLLRQHPDRRARDHARVPSDPGQPRQTRVAKSSTWSVRCCSASAWRPSCCR